MMAAAHDTRRQSFVLSYRNASRIGAVVLLLLGWRALTALVGAAVLPGPVETVGVATEGIIVEGWMLANFVNTLAALLGSFLVAVGVGGVIGIVLGSRESLRTVFEPFLLNTYAVPKIILFPVFLFIFQFGIDQKIAFGAFHGTFPMAIILMNAVREIPDIHRDVARSLQLSRWQNVRYVVLPSVLAPLIVGLRFAFNLSFLGVILSELFAARSGLGLILQNALGSVNRPHIMGVTFVIVVTALLVNFVFYGVQRYLEFNWGISVDEGGM